MSTEKNTEIKPQGTPPTDVPKPTPSVPQGPGTDFREQGETHAPVDPSAAPHK